MTTSTLSSPSVLTRLTDLRFALTLDAVVTGANGAAYLVAAGALDDLLGVPTGLLRGIGAFLPPPARVRSRRGQRRVDAREHHGRHRRLALTHRHWQHLDRDAGRRRSRVRRTPTGRLATYPLNRSRSCPHSPLPISSPRCRTHNAWASWSTPPTPIGSSGTSTGTSRCARQGASCTAGR